MPSDDRQSYALNKQNAKSHLRGHLAFSLHNNKATASRAVSRKNSADAALHSNLWVINKIGSVFSLFFITRYFPFLLHIPHFHVKIILL